MRVAPKYPITTIAELRQVQRKVTERGAATAEASMGSITTSKLALAKSRALLVRTRAAARR